MKTERKCIIEHFRELAELSGKPLKTEPTRRGERLIYAGRSVTLPSRGRRMPHINTLGSQLGLRGRDFRFI